MSKAFLAAVLCVSCSTALAFIPKPLLRAQPVAAALMPRAPTTKMSFDLATTYITALHNHYYPTTCLQALALVSLGDVLAQCLETTSNGDDNGAPIPLDWRRTLRMGTLGLIIGGLGTATWLRYLEDQLPVIESHAAASFVDLPLWLYEPVLRAFELSGPEHSVGLDTVADSLLVVVKATLDVCVWAPIANTLYLALTPLSEGRGFASAAESIRDNFIPVMKSELRTFFPYNLVAFALIPPLVRPFTTGVLSMAFSTYISWVTHLEPKLAIALATADARGERRTERHPEMARDAMLMERRTDHRPEMARDAMLMVAAMDAIDAMRADAARVVEAMEHTDAAR